MSVVLATDLEQAGRSPAELLVGHDGYGLVAIGVDVLIELGLTVWPDPFPEEPAHAVVVGPRQLPYGVDWPRLRPGSFGPQPFQPKTQATSLF